VVGRNYRGLGDDPPARYGQPEGPDKPALNQMFISRSDCWYIGVCSNRGATRVNDWETGESVLQQICVFAGILHSAERSSNLSCRLCSAEVRAPRSSPCLVGAHDPSILAHPMIGRHHNSSGAVSLGEGEEACQSRLQSRAWSRAAICKEPENAAHDYGLSRHVIEAGLFIGGWQFRSYRLRVMGNAVPKQSASFSPVLSNLLGGGSLE